MTRATLVAVSTSLIVLSACELDIEALTAEAGTPHDAGRHDGGMRDADRPDGASTDGSRADAGGDAGPALEDAGMPAPPAAAHGFDFPSDIVVESSAIGSFGTVVVGHGTRSLAGGSDQAFWATSIDADGAVTYATAFGGQFNDQLFAVDADAAHVYAVGFTRTFAFGAAMARNNDAVLVELGDSGVLSTRHMGIAGADETLFAIHTDDSGWVAGGRTAPGSDVLADALVIIGMPLTAWSIDLGQRDTVRGIATTPSRIYAVGTYQDASDPTNSRGFVLSIERSTGVLEWGRSVLGESFAELKRVRVDASGQLVVVGRRDGRGLRLEVSDIGALLSAEEVDVPQLVDTVLTSNGAELLAGTRMTDGYLLRRLGSRYVGTYVAGLGLVAPFGEVLRASATSGATIVLQRGARDVFLVGIDEVGATECASTALPLDATVPSSLTFEPIDSAVLGTWAPIAGWRDAAFTPQTIDEAPSPASACGP